MKTDVLLILFLYIFFTKLNDITILLSINVSGRPRRGAMDRNIQTSSVSKMIFLNKKKINHFYLFIFYVDNF